MSTIRRLREITNIIKEPKENKKKQNQIMNSHKLRERVCVPVEETTPERGLANAVHITDSSTRIRKKIDFSNSRGFGDMFNISPESPRFQQKKIITSPKQIEASEETTSAEKETVYFSDLVEEQLIAFFCKVPPIRFELCSVILKTNKFGTNPKLFGIIKANEKRGSIRGGVSDPASAVTSSNLFNRQFSDPLVLPRDTHFVSLNHDIHFRPIPTTCFIEINAELYVLVDEVDKDYATTDDNMKTNYNFNGDNYCKMVNHCDHFDFKGLFEWIIDSNYDDVEKDDNEVEMKNKITVEEEVDNVADVFKVCNVYLLIDLFDYLAQKPEGGPDYCSLIDHGGSLYLTYVTLKYAVDAFMEVEFVFKETEVVGSVMAYYGKDYDYGSPKMKHYYNAMLFETKPGVSVNVKPGKINLMRSLLAVPAKFSLIIDANLSDFNSGENILCGTYEFLVPCDGSSSLGFIKNTDTDCSLNLKVDWKLPFGMPSL